MGSIYRFRDKDGVVKWGEISVTYNSNNPRYDDDGSPMIPVVIDGGYEGAGKLRRIRIDEILEER